MVRLFGCQSSRDWYARGNSGGWRWVRIEIWWTWALHVLNADADCTDHITASLYLKEFALLTFPWDLGLSSELEAVMLYPIGPTGQKQRYRDNWKQNTKDSKESDLMFHVLKWEHHSNEKASLSTKSSSLVWKVDTDDTDSLLTTDTQQHTTALTAGSVLNICQLSC